MILVKFHKSTHLVVAICDKDLIGRVIQEGNMEIKVSEYFYKGEEKTEEEVSKIMEKYDNLNILGKESVGLALKLGVIDKENTLLIDRVPHAQRISC